MLSQFALHPSLATADAKRAREWYADKLGLTPDREWPGLLAYNVGKTMFTVYESPSAGTAENTVMIWNTADVRTEVARLRDRGVKFEDYDFGDFKTVDGIATDPEGDLNAWFRDPDGNTISLNHNPEAPVPAVGTMIAAANLARAKAWYQRLGLEVAFEMDGVIVVFRSGDARLSVYQTDSAGTAKNTVGVWRVPDLRAEVADLRSRGVTLEDYDFGDVETTDGVLVDDDGSLLAWFKDSEGNVLGLVEDHDRLE